MTGSGAVALSPQAHDLRPPKEDLLRTLRDLYHHVPTTPELVEVPAQRFLALDGMGDPTDAGSFQSALASLYPVAYTLKFDRKAHGGDFRMMPVEADWWTGPGDRFDPGRPRSEWHWSVRLAVPLWVSLDEVRSAEREAAARHPSRALQEVRLLTSHAGRAVHVLHVGPYSAEMPTIRRLWSTIEGLGLRPTGRHHEIYLGDPRRSAPERLRTVLRQPVR